MNAAGFSYYDILGVTPSASAEEIKSAYRAAMLKYHPDVNSAPNAQRLTEMLNDAYAVLSEPDQRRAYDTSLQHGGVTPTEPGEPAEELWDLYGCDRCGKIDAHLRYAIFYRVWSIIVYSQKQGVGGVLCSDCRSRLAWQTAVFSGFLVPWGFWGIFFTIHALYVSMIGGEKPRLQNAQLLRHQAIAFLQRGYLDEARTDLEDCLSISRTQRYSEGSTEAAILLDEEFMSQSRHLPGPTWLRGQTVALFALGLPVVLFLVIIWSFGSSGTSGTATGGGTAASPGSSTLLSYLGTTLNDDEQKCATSKKITNALDIYDTCVRGRHATAARIRIATTRAGREGLQTIDAIEGVQEASAAYDLGWRDKARAGWAGAVSTLKSMRTGAVDQSIRKLARSWDDCLEFRKC